MRYIKIPEPFVVEHVTIGAEKEQPKVEFPTFVRQWLAAHPDIMKTNDNMTYFREICTEVKDMKPGDTLELNKEQHDFLSNIARTNQYAADVKLYVIPHVQAITMAPAADPRKEPKEPPVVEEKSKGAIQ
jgi:hypothetical protein